MNREGVDYVTFASMVYPVTVRELHDPIARRDGRLAGSAGGPRACHELKTKAVQLLMKVPKSLRRGEEKQEM
jgi:hypothetical protein